MEILTTMFATFVGFVTGVLFITEMVNKMFKVENTNVRLIVSWVMSFGLAALGLWLQVGFFADCGTPDTWQGWVKAMFIGLGCGWCANYMYDRNEMWRLLEWLFSFFEKDGKEKRITMAEEAKARRAMKKLLSEENTDQIPMNETHSYETDNKLTAVDLGLPSGTKWADRNVGAKSPEETGLFFSWGNVDGVEIGKACDFSEEAYAETEGAKMKGNLDAAHDAATVNMGAPWRMPTDEEFQELYDNCDWEWTTENGYNGVRFTSKINGNRLFFSASGYGAGSSWNDRGANGYYWSASFLSARYARSLNFYSGGVYPQDNSLRYLGFAVRAVQN